MKNNNYTVVHSPNDLYLLARLSTDLIMEGVKDDREWNEYLMGGKGAFDKLFFIYLNDNTEFVYRLENWLNEPEVTLTEENYLDVLETILKRHK